MRFAFILAVLLLTQTPALAADSRFSFDDIKTVPAMQAFIEDNLPLGTPKEKVQRAFVLQGHATLRNHPSEKYVEKYLYDINLCEYYIFRWNISADYDDKGSLVQMYINGIAVFPEGKQQSPLPPPKAGNKARVVKTTRDWPQAKKGALKLSYLLFDADGDTKTTNDQRISGLGATNVDPADFGPGIRFHDVELWRSIYDEDISNDIATYAGSCKQADIKYMSRELLEPRHGVMP